MPENDDLSRSGNGNRFNEKRGRSRKNGVKQRSTCKTMTGKVEKLGIIIYKYYIGSEDSK